MAVEVVLSEIGSGFNRSVINTNFTNIQSALQNALSRAGTSPNQMGADIDLNSHDLLNVADLDATRIYINGVEITTSALAKGDRGWSPVFAIVTDGTRRVLKLTAWVGGGGDAPTIHIGQYVGAAGFTSVIGSAVDIRGPQGATGPGTGDLVAAQNLSDVANAATAFSNIIQAASAAEIAARTSAVKVITPSNAGYLVPLGVIFDYTGTIAPTGWVFPYGQAVSRATYSAYFALVGTTFGAGDGSTTFNLPDLRGRVIAGQDDMGGVSADRLTGVTGSVDGDTFAAAGGSETHALTEAQLPAHTHTYGPKTAVYGANGQTYSDFRPSAGDSNRMSVSLTTNTTGGNASHNNVQPTVILNKILFVGV